MIPVALQNKTDSPSANNAEMKLKRAVTEINSLTDTYKKKQLLFNVCFGAGIVMIFLLSTLAVAISPQHSSGIVIFLVLGGIVLFVVGFKVIAPDVSRLRKQLDVMYGNDFIPNMFAEHFDNVYYRHDDGFQQGTIDNMDIFPSGDYIYTSEDFIIGDYQGIHFETADVCIRDTSTRQGGKKYITSDSSGMRVEVHGRTIFKGRMFIITTHCKRVESLKIMDTFQSNVIAPPKNKKVEMESVKFNNAFNVYSQNAHDAFWVLTPQKQETFLKLKKKYVYWRHSANGVSCNYINFHYKGSELYVTISGNMNAFNSTTYPIDIEKERKKFEKDVNVIKDIIENLLPNELHEETENVKNEWEEDEETAWNKQSANNKNEPSKFGFSLKK